MADVLITDSMGDQRWGAVSAYMSGFFSIFIQAYLWQPLGFSSEVFINATVVRNSSPVGIHGVSNRNVFL